MRVRGHRGEADHVREQHGRRREVVGDHRAPGLEASHDLVRKDVVQEVVGPCLKPISLANEVRQHGQGDDARRDEVEGGIA